MSELLWLEEEEGVEKVLTGLSPDEHGELPAESVSGPGLTQLWSAAEFWEAAAAVFSRWASSSIVNVLKHNEE